VQIDLIEAGDEFAKGIAWEKGASSNAHLMNTYGQAEAVDSYYRRRGMEFSESDDKHLKKGEVPRYLYGKIRAEQFAELVNLLRADGVDVRLSSNTVVTSIEKSYVEDDGTQTYLIDLEKNGQEQPSRSANIVVLATGHWQGKSKTNQHEGVFASPWPASKLEQGVDLNKPVAVMGTGLSAIDAVMTLAHKAGTFEHKGGKLVFTPNADASHFKVDMISPHGMLPPMLGHVDDERFLSPSVMQHYQDAANHPERNVKLDDVYQWFKEDFLERFKSHAGQPEFEGIKAALSDDSMKIEDVVAKLYEAYNQKGAAQALREQIARGKESRQQEEVIPYQNFLRSYDVIIETFQNHFSAEDKIRFMRHVRPLLTKFAYGIVESNADQLLALMEAGCLDVKALGEHSSLATSQGTKGADVRYQDASGQEHNAHYDSVIKASGDDVYRLKQSSPLMKSLFDGGLAKPVLFKYDDQALGRAEYERQQKMDPAEQRTVVRKSGADGKWEYYHDAGGLDMNASTFELVNEKGKSQESLFALGPPLKARLPVLEGIGPIDYQSKHIAQAIESRIAPRRSMRPQRVGLGAALGGSRGVSKESVRAMVENVLGKQGDEIRVLTGGDFPELGDVLERIFTDFLGPRDR
jgi:uncharacterized NAD(P)/FAD-binding protein YdhS